MQRKLRKKNDNLPCSSFWSRKKMTISVPQAGRRPTMAQVQQENGDAMAETMVKSPVPDERSHEALKREKNEMDLIPSTIVLPRIFVDVENTNAAAETSNESHTKSSSAQRLSMSINDNNQSGLLQKEFDQPFCLRGSGRTGARRRLVKTLSSLAGMLEGDDSSVALNRQQRRNSFHSTLSAPTVLVPHNGGHTPFSLLEPKHVLRQDDTNSVDDKEGGEGPLFLVLPEDNTNLDDPSLNSKFNSYNNNNNTVTLHTLTRDLTQTERALLHHSLLSTQGNTSTEQLLQLMANIRMGASDATDVTTAGTTGIPTRATILDPGFFGEP